MLTWINDLFRSLISVLDRMVYWVIELLVYLFNEIAKIQLFTGEKGDNFDFIDAFSERIFMIITIVMIFKVSFSIIQYIINPDTFTDKERGMGKIIQSILLTLVCLVGVKYVFRIAYDFQYRIVNNHVIETLILGMDANMKVTESKQEDASNHIPFTILSSFITLNTTNVSNFQMEDGNYICFEISDNIEDTDDIKMENKTEMLCPKPNGCENWNNGNTYYSDSNFTKEFINCINTNSKEGNIDKFVVDTGEKQITFHNADTGNIYAAAHDYYNYNLLLDLINHKWEHNPDVYIFDYKLIISTVAGIFAAIIYLNFCIDLAVRTVKFAFLQLIAPIPIISMIDPKSTKNGMMSKWVKNCVSTYLGLFIRIAAVSFVVFIISLISDGGALSGNIGNNGFVKLFIIFGVLMFAKELPKLISELTGIDLKGDFKLNPLTRLPGGKLATNAAKGTALAAGSMLGAGAAIAGRATVGGLGAGVQAIGHKFAPNRFKRTGSEIWAGASNDISSRFRHNGAGALNHLRNGLPKPMQNIGKGGSSDEGKAMKEYREHMNQLKQGEKLADTLAANNNDYNSIFSNPEYASAVSDMASAKINMYKANDEVRNLEDMVRKGTATHEQLNEAVKRQGQATKLYEKRKEHVNQLGKFYKSDAKKLQALDAYNDLHPATTHSTSPSIAPTSASAANAQSSISTPTSTSTSSTTSSSTSASTYSSEDYKFDGYEVASRSNYVGEKSMPSAEREMPSVGSNKTSGEMPSAGSNNTGGGMPSVGSNKAGGGAPSADNNPSTPFDPSHMDG